MGAARFVPTVEYANKENHEGSGISQEDLRQVQDRAPQGRGAGDLRELETQAETRIDGLGNLAIGSLKTQTAQQRNGPIPVQEDLGKATIKAGHGSLGE